MYIIDRLSLTIILLLLLMNFSNEGYEWFYEKNKRFFCANKEKWCTFTISYNKPISPKIPTVIPSHAILSEYRYIYLIFDILEGKKNKFYLMAYDSSTKDTIISNGDAYIIDCNQNNKYEIQIFKTLKNNSFIQFLFLGLPKNFNMKVEIRFKLDQLLYLEDFKLNDLNSLKSSNDELLLEYLDEINNKSNAQKERIVSAKKNFCKITQNFFDTTINLNKDEFESTYSEIIMTPPGFVVIISYEVGLEISTEKFFETENNILSETKVINGKIYSHYDGFDLLIGKKNLDNNILKYIDLYNKNIQDIILSFGIEKESYSITVSTNESFNCTLFTLRFFNDIGAGTIKYEIEIKIEANNIMLSQLEKFPKPAYSFNWSYLNENRRMLITGVIYTLIITSAILTNDSASGLLTLPV